MRDPHQNMFYYYRGPTNKKKASKYDIQVEDNTTKSLINILEFCNDINFQPILRSFFKLIRVKNSPILSFKLQKAENASRPDGVIRLIDSCVYIEAKVKAKLKIDQISRHLRALSSNDNLIIITDNTTDRDRVSAISDRRLRHITWSDIHKICLTIISGMKNNKKYGEIKNIINQFIDFLEVVAMTNFNGFKNDDFDFWLDYNPYYASILKNKMSALVSTILNTLPPNVKDIYSSIKIGNISKSIKDERYAWLAIKKPKGTDLFNQCNFTIELSKDSISINAVIRNGRVNGRKSPIAIFYRKLENPKEFLNIIKKIKRKSLFVISRRLPKTGKRIMPGNERWERFFAIALKDIRNNNDVKYLQAALSKAEFPGIHIKFSIPRGDDILLKPNDLQNEIVAVICDFKPILTWLEKS